MRKRFVSVRVKQAAAMGAFIAVVSLLLAVFLPNRLDAVARRWAERGAEGIALVLAKAVSAAVSFSEVQDTTADMVQDLSNLASADGARYAVIEHRNGSVLATWIHEKAGATQRFEAARRALGDAPTQYVEGYLFVRTPILAYDPGAKRDVELATLTVGFSMDALSQQRRENLMVVIVLTAVLLVVGLALAFVMGGIIVRPILALARATETITDSGDLTQRVTGMSADEIGALSQQFNEMIEQLHSMFTAVKRSVDGLGGAIKLIKGAGNRVARGAESIDMRLQDTSACVEEMLASISSTAENVETLEQGAKEGSSVILSIASGNDRVAEDMQTMAAAASSATTDVEQIGTFVQGSAQRISDLTQIIDETTTEMDAIRAAVDKVEKESDETSRLAEAVSQDAARGQEAIERTLGGISRIQQSSQIVADSIGVLARYTENIDEILTVIGGVTEQTTLLALNAAIIAARAGENGRGFSIVADEIRSLAERTRRQTDEIAKLIHNLQTEAKKAARSIEEGVSDVREGVELGRAAKQSLDEILASAEAASIRVRHIAEATTAQGSSTRKVADSLAKVNRMVQSINNATEEQAKRTAQIIDSTTTMNGLAQQVRQAGREQAAGSKRITAAMERIQRMVGEVRKAQHEQRFASGEVLKAVDAIRQTAGEQREAASHLETVIQTLSRQDDELQRELRRFRAPAPSSSSAPPDPRPGKAVPLRAGKTSPARVLPT